MGEVWPTAHITELCLQLTAGSRPANGDEHRALESQSCERALLTMGDLPFTLTLVLNWFSSAIFDIFYSNCESICLLCPWSVTHCGTISVIHSRGLGVNFLPAKGFKRGGGPPHCVETTFFYRYCRLKTVIQWCIAKNRGGYTLEGAEQEAPKARGSRRRRRRGGWGSWGGVYPSPAD